MVKRLLTLLFLGLTYTTLTWGQHQLTKLVVDSITGDTIMEGTHRLDEVVVKSGRLRYSRKNNPAVELMKRVIAARDSSRLENHSYYQYNKYQKLSFSRNDYKPGADSLRAKDEGLKTKGEGQKAKGKFNWAEHTEISPYNNKVIMPLSVSETVTQHVFRKSPRSDKDIILGSQTSGLNELLATGDIVNTLLKDVFKDVNIYDDYVTLLKFPFTSPIGHHAINFYHFYIVDTVCVERDSCYHLTFFPNNQRDIGFNGDLYVLKDSSLHVKKCSLRLPRKSEVNFVDNMHIDQVFTKLPNGEWVLTEDEAWAEMSLFKKSVLVVRSTRLTDYAFDELPKNLFSGRAHEKTVANAYSRDDSFWDKYRQVQLTKKESSVSGFINQLKRYKALRLPLFLIKCFAENYIETGTADTPSKFDFGPMMSTFTSNYVDGFRARVSGRTMGALNKHWFWDGYYAHGFRSKGNYYGSKVTYSFNRKKNSPFEFPQRSVSFESSYDVMSTADRDLANDKDNTLIGIRTEKIDKMYYYNRQKLTFTYETDYGLNFTADLKTESNTAAGNLHFIHVNDGTEQSSLRTTSFSVSLDYAPGQTYINMKQMRLPINFDAPEIFLRHTMGFKGFLGGQYRMNQTDIGLYKRQWLGSFGFVDLHLNMAIEWNKLPFHLLMTPPTDLSYIEQEDPFTSTFNMLHNMEFFMDRKFFWSLSWDLNGKLFNRIPLIKKLKLREYVAVKGLWGKLTDVNNPTLAENANDKILFEFPEGSYAISPSKPYMEIMVGIRNIFKFFSVEWVHRLSYNDHPGTRKNGVRFGLQVSF